MKTFTFTKKAILCIVFFNFSICGFAQIYTPSGATNSNSSSTNNNIGIGTNNPTGRLHINSEHTNGLLFLNATETPGSTGPITSPTGSSTSGTPNSPAYAFKLDYTPLDFTPTTRFLIDKQGKTHIGAISGHTNATSQLNVLTDFMVMQSNTKYMRMGYTGFNPGITWTSNLSEGFSISSAQSTNIASFSYDGRVAFGTDQFIGNENFHVVGVSRFDSDILAAGIHASFLGVGTTTPKGLLHVKKLNVSNSGTSGQSHGIIIENNGWRGHDYSLEVKSGHGRIFTIANSGHVFIGSGLNLDSPDPTNYRLYVEKGIRTEGVRIDIANENLWADYVFAPEYKLMPIYEVEKYIEENSHLPSMPSAKEVVENGMDVSEMNKLLLQHVEELTLRMIEMQKEIDALKSTK